MPDLFHVTDGDTLKLHLDQGFDTIKVMTCRLKGIDCPEKSTDAGKLCKQVVSEWVYERMEAGLLWRSHEWDKYGRSLGDLFDADNVPLSSYLLNLRIAKEYSGEGRRSWTEQELQNIVDRCKKVIG
jgi:endonuclease YncB( thermonuclease family)